MSNSRLFSFVYTQKAISKKRQVVVCKIKLFHFSAMMPLNQANTHRFTFYHFETA